MPAFDPARIAHWRLAVAVMLGWNALQAATGTLPAPYLPDEHTLHLWHLDEPKPPAINAVDGARSMLSVHNGAVLGAPGHAGFGGCFRNPRVMVPPANIALFHGGILLAAPRLASDTSDNVSPPFPYSGPDGSFTMEALVKLDVLPENLPTHAAMILSMDDDDVDVRRIFHFRIDKSGHLSFSPLPGSDARGGCYARLPTVGPHAVAVDVWYHAAVTYDGNAGTTDNMRLFWTRLDSGATEANPIGSGTLTGDLNGDLGDFAIGNEARQFRGNGESEPFAGSIDEVRISSIARSPADFLFGYGRERTEGLTAADGPGSVTIRLESVKANGASYDPATARNGVLTLPPGQHRLDIGFRHLTGPTSGPLKVTYQLTGADDGWRESIRGMTVTCQFLDGGGEVLSESSFPITGTSAGWEGNIADSTMLPRREPLMVPDAAVLLRVRISSGTPDTTGALIIDRLRLEPAMGGPFPDPAGSPPSSGTASSPDYTSTSGWPAGWSRGAGDPSISRTEPNSSPTAVALVDGASGQHGEWITTAPLPASVSAGQTLAISWLEAYNVIEGQQHLASYLKVPPGNYVFRTAAIALNGSPNGNSASLHIHIPTPLIQRPWFAPVLVGGLVALISTLIVMALRHRNQNRLQRLRLQTELERDRTRIARDMHDDLGTVATAITMTASLARRNLATDPAKAAEHLQTVGRSARKLVGALDDLVWAVDPANDTLDELGVHLIRLIEDLFTDSGIRHRIRIPDVLPRTHLGSETRHHLALAVKEALHNVLQHSGADEVSLVLTLHPPGLEIEVRDNGRGFDPGTTTGNGLVNMRQRLQSIGGQCEVFSTPGAGSTIVFKLTGEPASKSKATP